MTGDVLGRLTGGMRTPTPVAVSVVCAAVATLGVLACADPGPKPPVQLPHTMTADPVPASQGPQPTSIPGDGLWAVGLTIGVGTYSATVPGGDGCQYGLYADRDGTDLMLQRSNLSPGTQLRVEITRSVKSFRTTGCGSWQLVDAGV